MVVCDAPRLAFDGPGSGELLSSLSHGSGNRSISGGLPGILAGVACEGRVGPWLVWEGARMLPTSESCCHGARFLFRVGAGPSSSESGISLTREEAVRLRNWVPGLENGSHGGWFFSPWLLEMSILTDSGQSVFDARLTT